MLNWSILFLIVAVIAGVFGFTGVAGTSYEFAKILFFVFVVLFALAIIMGRRTNDLV
jgi:uncharacterized membrane protein YtjA (UPF0391 family)